MEHLDFVTVNTIPEKRTGAYLYVMVRPNNIAAYGLSYADAVRAQTAKVPYYTPQQAAPWLAQMTPRFNCQEPGCGATLLTPEGKARHQDVTEHFIFAQE